MILGKGGVGLASTASYYHSIDLVGWSLRLFELAQEAQVQLRGYSMAIVACWLLCRLCATLIAQSVERWTLTREAKIRFPAAAVGVVVLSKPLMHSCFGLLSRWIMNE